MLKIGDFPVLMFPKTYGFPLFIISFVLFARMLLSPWSKTVFEVEWVRQLVVADINLFVALFFYWMLTNPGIAGFYIGSK